MGQIPQCSLIFQPFCTLNLVRFTFVFFKCLPRTSYAGFKESLSSSPFPFHSPPALSLWGWEILIPCVGLLWESGFCSPSPLTINEGERCPESPAACRWECQKWDSLLVLCRLLQLENDVLWEIGFFACSLLAWQVGKMVISYACLLKSLCLLKIYTEVIIDDMITMYRIYLKIKGMSSTQKMRLTKHR